LRPGRQGHRPDPPAGGQTGRYRPCGTFAGSSSEDLPASSRVVRG
jgi:hypothetical protein